MKGDVQEIAISEPGFLLKRITLYKTYAICPPIDPKRHLNTEAASMASKASTGGDAPAQRFMRATSQIQNSKKIDRGFLIIQSTYDWPRSKFDPSMKRLGL